MLRLNGERLKKGCSLLSKKMKNIFDKYKKSFAKKEIGYVFLVDILFWVVVFLVVMGSLGYVNIKAAQLGGGASLESLNSKILSMSQEEMQSFSSQLKGLALQLAGIVVFLIAFCLLLFSYSRFYIWKLLVKGKEKYWKWNVLNLILLIFLVAYSFLAAAVRGGLLYVLDLPYKVGIIASPLIIIFFSLIFVDFLFLNYYHFSKGYKVWRTLEKAFSDIRRRFKLLSICYGYQWLTFLVISLVLVGAVRFLPEDIFSYVNLVVLLLFLAWSRVFFVDLIKD